MSTLDDVQSIIDRAVTIADDATATAANYSQQAIDATNIFVDFGTANVGFTPSVLLDVVSSSGLTTPTGLDDITNFPSTIDDITNRLISQFSLFFATYFPNDCAPHVKAVDWLCDVFTTGGTGIPAAVENQIWQRDRDRILVDANRASDDAVSSWAARGFPLPPGAAAFQVHLINENAQNAIAQSSRDRAIQAAQIAIENTRFAVTNAIDWRIKSLSAAGDYIRTLAIGPQLGSDLVRTQVDARARAAEVIASYYRARVDAAQSYNSAKIELEKLRYDPIKTTSLNKVDLNKAFGATQVGIAEARAQAALGAARATGDMAAAAMSGVNAIAHLSTTESI